MMPSPKNRVIVACAGSGKTTILIDEAKKLAGKRVLITTYTNENLEQIRDFFIGQNGWVPEHVTIQSWFTFLLHDGVRPYQNQMVLKPRVNSICFPQTKKSRWQKKSDYITASNDIYRDKTSEFVWECNRKTSGAVLARLGKMYDYIFVDEMQDLAGYDWELLNSLFDSGIGIIAVGDPRQSTYLTNNASKNKQYRGKERTYVEWLRSKEIAPKVFITELVYCHRCNQNICDFADALFPGMPKSISRNLESTKHDGIFQIKRDSVVDYYNTYKPVILRWNKNENTFGLPAMNIGVSKGRTYDRVLVFPTKPMCDYLKTGDITKAGDKHKLYVAITRARHSIAFAVD